MYVRHPFTNNRRNSTVTGELLPHPHLERAETHNRLVADASCTVSIDNEPDVYCRHVLRYGITWRVTFTELIRGTALLGHPICIGMKRAPYIQHPSWATQAAPPPRRETVAIAGLLGRPEGIAESAGRQARSATTDMPPQAQAGFHLAASIPSWQLSNRC